MKRVFLGSAVISAIVCSAAIAWAAEGTPFAEPTAKLESVLGREVKTLREGDGGRVIDLLVDNDGQVRAAVIEFGGFLGIGTRKIAVDWSALRFAGPSLVVDISRDQLRATPEYKEREKPILVKPTMD
jgi:hypothetical protein